jgi:O-antigen/teichoic acid export membrane protein
MQIQAGILLAVPIMMGILIFAEQILSWLYTNDFIAAKGILIYLTIAIAIRLISWPIGYWLLGHSSSLHYFIIEGVGALIAPAAAWILIPKFGIIGLGYASCVAAAAYSIIVVGYLREKTGAELSGRTWVFILVSAGTFILSIYLSDHQIGKIPLAACLVTAGVFAGYAYKKNSRNDA